MIALLSLKELKTKFVIFLAKVQTCLTSGSKPQVKSIGLKILTNCHNINNQAFLRFVPLSQVRFEALLSYRSISLNTKQWPWELTLADGGKRHIDYWKLKGKRVVQFTWPSIFRYLKLPLTTTRAREAQFSFSQQPFKGTRTCSILL